MTPDWTDQLADRHTLICGGTRVGKSYLLILMVWALLRRQLEGLTAIDPHGSFVRAVIDILACPANGFGRRKIHILNPSGSHTFGLNPLAPINGSDSWEACHDAANTLASVVESRFEASPEETPRLSRILYIGGMLCARKGLTVLELVEILSIGGDELRRSLLQDFDNRIVRRELEDLHLLASKHPARFLETVESCKNRFVRWLGDPRLARILGQPKGISPLALMDSRAICLADFSSLNYDDAAFLGCILSSMFFAAARRRPPMQCARHRLILDEAESLLTVAVARMCDGCAKQGLNLVAAVQRLGQLRERGDFLFDALLTNCGVKICFGNLEVESARYMAEQLFTGYVPLEEYKQSSLRPVAVGNEKTTVRGTSHSIQEAEHEMRSHTSMRSHARAVGSMSSTSTGTGTFSGTGENAGMVMSPPTSMFAPGAASPQMILSESTGDNSSRGSSEQSATSAGTSTMEMDSEGAADTIAFGKSRGWTKGESTNEVFVTRYEWLPSQMFSLEEQLHRLTGELMTLQRRELFIKIESERPYRTRTADLPPAFRSSFYKRTMLPLFLKAIAARSPYLTPATQVDAAIATRFAGLLKPPPQPEPDFTPEPMPIVDAPGEFAKDFWRTHKPPTPDDEPPKPKPKTPKGRRPLGDLGSAHDQFRVVDGDKKD